MMKYVIFIQKDLIPFIDALIFHSILMWKIKAKVKNQQTQYLLFLLKKCSHRKTFKQY